MIVVPSIDIEGGRVVKRIRGVRGSGRSDLGDPLEWAERWRREGCRGLHVVDLDAAEGVGSNRETIGRLLEASSVPVAIGGGFRTTEEIEVWVDRGTTRILLSTRAWLDAAWRREIVSKFGDRLTFCADVSTGRLRLDGWRSDGPTLDEALRELATLGAGSLLYTAIEPEGTGRGIPLGELEHVRSEFVGELRYAGGIGSRADLETLARTRVDVATVGHALISGELPGSVVHEEFE
ncbi:MAG: HisA/HisF-related TIM barrel protein [Thermoplasmata archaeon]|nr:HisA/HisF-related TIM barrel protein [Thermoplasmata archaeon]